MTVSTSKTNYPKVRLLKTLRHSFVKILQPSQKRLNHDAFLTGTTKELSTMPKTFCVHRYHCKKTNACGKIMLCGIKCTSCPTCNQTCKDFEKELCCRLDKAPYVCNGCPMKINHCTIAHKYRYDARFADRKYRELLSSSRAGINIPASAAPKRPDCYSVDRTGTVTLSDPDQSSGTGYVCPLHVHIHR